MVSDVLTRAKNLGINMAHQIMDVKFSWDADRLKFCLIEFYSLIYAHGYISLVSWIFNPWSFSLILVCVDIDVRGFLVTGTKERCRKCNCIQKASLAYLSNALIALNALDLVWKSNPTIFWQSAWVSGSCLQRISRATAVLWTACYTFLAFGICANHILHCTWNLCGIQFAGRG